MKPVCVTIWGCRGSYPAPFPDRMEFGGNTSCISLEYEDRVIVLDAGTGIVPFGRVTDWAEKNKRVDIFISHIHLDHIMGLYMFQPLYDPEMKIHIYGTSMHDMSLKYQIESLISPPYWPMNLKSLPAEVEYHTMDENEPLMLYPDIEVRAGVSNHPGKCLCYLIHIDGRSILYATDCEMDESIWNELVSFGTGCDLLICDAQFRPEELEVKKGWGHSSWSEGNRLLHDCNAGKVLHTHFDWDAGDNELRERERMAVGGEPCAVFAREGMVIHL